MEVCLKRFSATKFVSMVYENLESLEM
jgi:hypothetical protein